MKKTILLLALLALPFMAQAQVRFAFFSYSEALKSMPEYIKAQQDIATLRGKYDAETRRATEEFNRKYEEFLDGQRDFAPTILQKRQVELQEIMQKNVAFKQQAERLLRQAEEDAMAPVKARLTDTVRRIGRSRGYAFVLNTDNDACPYIDPSMGEDITAVIKDELK